MDRAAFAQFAIGKEDAGAVFSYLKGIAFLDVPFTHQAIADIKISGNTVDIDCGDAESGAR